MTEKLINELGDDTLSRYRAAAHAKKASIASKRGPKSKTDKIKVAKLETGIDKASQVTSARRTKASDAAQLASHAGYKSAVHGQLLKHGYKEVHRTKASAVYMRHDPHTNSILTAKHHFGQPSTSESHGNHVGELSMTTTNGTTSNHRHDSFGAGMKAWRDTDGSSADVQHHFEAHSKSLDDAIKAHHDYHERAAFRSHLNEEAGQSEDFFLKGLEENFDTITEGRGRPRKDGTSAVGGDRSHIMMQVRKHISLKGTNPIEFADGSKHDVEAGEARLAHSIHGGLRTTQEKSNFEKKLDKSHASWKATLASKTGHGDEAPEEKSKISLPGLDRLKARIAAEKGN